MGDRTVSDDETIICRLCHTDRPGERRGGGGLHRICLLRSGTGGVGHLLDHDYWCTERNDTDAGLSFYDSALCVDELVYRYGPDAVGFGTFIRPTLAEVKQWAGLDP
jgi:hypothetical protein